MARMLGVDPPDAATGPPARHAWRLPAETASVPQLRHAVQAFAREHGVPETVVADIAIAVTEAVTNAVLHAYVDRDRGEVEVVAQAARDEVVVRVLDDGRGMQPRPDSPGLRVGLPTIGQLTRAVDIRERPGGGTEVRMRFAAPGVRGPATELSEDDDRYELLARVSAVSQEGGWPARGLTALGDLLVPAIADACAIDVLSADGEPRRVAAKGADLPERSGAAREALRAGDVVVADEPAGDLAHWILLPLADDARVLGLLHVGLRAERGRPEPDQLAFLKAVADRAAGGLANTQLIDELRRTQRRLERILGALAEAVTVHGDDGRTIYANDAAVELLGASSLEELLSAEPGELAARFAITKEDGSPLRLHELPGRRLLDDGIAEPMLTRSVHRETGRARWLLTKATLLDDEGPLAVNIIEDVTEAKTAELRQRFLAGVGETLGATLDYEATLRAVAELVVPDLADWCVVDLADGGRMQRVAVAHKDPEKLAVAREIDRRYPPPAQPGEGVRALLAGGEALLYPELTDEMLAAGAQDEEHLRMLIEVGMRSVMLLPMRTGDRTIGVLTMINAESERSFVDDDLAFGQDIARRAATAVENARLYRERG